MTDPESQRCAFPKCSEPRAMHRPAKRWKPETHRWVNNTDHDFVPPKEEP